MIYLLSVGLTLVGMMTGYALGYAHGREDGAEDAYDAVERYYEGRGR